MLTASERPAFRTRVKGRDALVRSLGALLVRAHRFGRHRATTDADRRWTARLLDALQAALDVARTHPEQRSTNS